MKRKFFLSRLHGILLWVTALLGLVLLIDTVKTVIHMALCLVAFAVMVMAHTAPHSKAARVVSRILCAAVPLAFAVLLCVYIGFYVAALRTGAGTVALSDRPTTILAVIGTPLLCWTLPAAGTLAAKGGRYDAWVMRVLYTVTAAMAVYVCFGAPIAYIPWHWEAPLLRYVWVAAAAVGCISAWIPVFRKEKGEA